MSSQSETSANELLARADAAIAAGDYRQAIGHYLRLMEDLSRSAPEAVEAFSEGPYANLLIAAATHAMALAENCHFIDALDLIRDIRVYFSGSAEMLDAMDGIRQRCLEQAPYDRSSPRATDVLLYCAGADKEALQVPLAEALGELGVLVASESIEVDSRSSASELAQQLEESDALVVVLSPDFFAGAWPRDVLEGLLSGSGADAARVLPVWHGITRPEVLAASAPLERTLAFDTANSSIAQIAQGIVDIVRPDLASGALNKLLWASILQGKPLGAGFVEFELPVRHAAPDDDLIARIRLIRAAFLDGCRQPMAAWVSGFSRELDPCSAIVEWEAVARAFHDCRTVQRHLLADTESVLTQLAPPDLDREDRDRFRDIALEFARCPADRLFMHTWLVFQPWGRHADIGFPLETQFVGYLLANGIRMVPDEADFETQWHAGDAPEGGSIQTSDWSSDGMDWSTGTLQSEDERASSKPWDVFISHASEDKTRLVRPLADALKDYGVKVWYDTFNLRPGLSLGSSIDAGIEGAEFGIVVLSPHFIVKEWPRYEFDALSRRLTQQGGRLVTLWHELGPERRPDWVRGLDPGSCLDTAELPITALAMRVLEWVRPDIARVTQRRLEFAATQDKADRGQLKTKRINASEIAPSPRRYERLPPALEARVDLVRAVLSEVRPHSMMYWIDGFLRDYNPERQIEFWERFAAMYQEAVCVVDWMQETGPKGWLQKFKRKPVAVDHADIHRILNRLLHTQDAARELSELRQAYPEKLVDTIAAIAASPTVIEVLDA